MRGFVLGDQGFLLDMADCCTERMKSRLKPEAGCGARSLVNKLQQPVFCLH